MRNMTSDHQPKNVHVTIWTCIWLLQALLVMPTTTQTVTQRMLRLCGSELADALELLCNSNYYLGPSKRSETSSSIHLQRLVHPPAFTFRSLLGRVKRGASSECCKSERGCSYETLMRYCQAPYTELTNAPFWSNYENQRTPQTTQEPPELTPTTTIRPAIFESNTRKWISFFYVHATANPTRNPRF